MPYVPTKITLTRSTGFDEQTALPLRDAAQDYDIDPRVLAAKLVALGVRNESVKRIMDARKKPKEAKCLRTLMTIG